MVLTLFDMEGIPERQMMLRPLEIAEIFGVSRQTVKNWIGRGVLRHQKIEGEYFVPREDVEALMRCDEGIVKTEERLKMEEKKCEEAWQEMRLRREAIGDMVKFYGIVVEAVDSWMKIGEKKGGLDRQSAELVMCIMRGMTVNEIAEGTGLTLQQIRRGIAVALGRMRKLGQTDETERRPLAEDRLGMLVTELGLPARVQNALVEARINTVGDLVKYRKKELLNIKRCSLKTMDLLAEVVEKRLGLSFKNDTASVKEVSEENHARFQ